MYIGAWSSLMRVNTYILMDIMASLVDNAHIGARPSPGDNVNIKSIYIIYMAIADKVYISGQFASYWGISKRR